MAWLFLRRDRGNELGVLEDFLRRRNLGFNLAFLFMVFLRPKIHLENPHHQYQSTVLFDLS
jgi:hypothetical protein